MKYLNCNKENPSSYQFKRKLEKFDEPSKPYIVSLWYTLFSDWILSKSMNLEKQNKPCLKIGHMGKNIK